MDRTSHPRSALSQSAMEPSLQSELEPGRPFQYSILAWMVAVLVFGLFLAIFGLHSPMLFALVMSLALLYLAAWFFKVISYRHSRLRLARRAFAARQFENAERWLRSACQVMQYYDPDRGQALVVDTLWAAGAEARNDGRFADAEWLFHRAALACENWESRGRMYDISLSQCLSELAIVLQLQEKFTEAEAVLVRLLEIQRRVPDGDFRDVARTEQALATLRSQIAQPGEGRNSGMRSC
jgi:hypothetical protein